MTYIIAEIGSNHDGDFERAKILIRLASECGADAVKFQTFDADKLVHPELRSMVGEGSQHARFKSLQFNAGQWKLLQGYSKDQGVDFMTTCFDHESMLRYGRDMPYIKISSGDLTYDSLLRLANEFRSPVLVSTGMAEWHEIERIPRLIHPDKLILMHCVSSYPTQDQDANLGCLNRLKHIARIGYSDHTIGFTACLAAVGMGVEVIEKHFTDDSSKSGDHSLSADPEEMDFMVSEIRRLDLMMGNEKPCKSELENRYKMRRGAYASQPIEKGAIITESDILAIRPATRYPPDHYIGRKARRDLKRLDELC